jgi:DNA-binding transcriptional regulator YiaG
LSNIVIALKAEVTRLARKEVRSETAKLKKASAQYRSDIAALKRRVAVLEKQLSLKAAKTTATTSAPELGDSDTGIRYSAKGFSAHRSRLGLSAADMGLLLGVSDQSIYKWEAGKSRPRRRQMEAIGAIRAMGKREAAARLRQLVK